MEFFDVVSVFLLGFFFGHIIGYSTGKTKGRGEGQVIGRCEQYLRMKEATRQEGAE